MNRQCFALTLGALSLSMPIAAQAAFQFRTINVPNSAGTFVYRLNNNGMIAGYQGPNGHSQGLTSSPPYSRFASVNFANAVQTQVYGLNQMGDTDGLFNGADGNQHGFLSVRGRLRQVDFPGSTQSVLNDLNSLEQAVGVYQTLDRHNHPMVYQANAGVFATLSIPGAVDADVEGTSDGGSLCGTFTDANHVVHGWLLANGTFRTLDPPGSTVTVPFGVNNRSQVVGAYTTAASRFHGFTWSSGRFQTVDHPLGAGGTFLNGLNDRGQLAGYYVDAAGKNNGFITQ